MKTIVESNRTKFRTSGMLRDWRQKVTTKMTETNKKEDPERLETNVLFKWRFQKLGTTLLTEFDMEV